GCLYSPHAASGLGPTRRFIPRTALVYALRRPLAPARDRSRGKRASSGPWNCWEISTRGHRPTSRRRFVNSWLSITTSAVSRNVPPGLVLPGFDAAQGDRAQASRNRSDLRDLSEESVKAYLKSAKSKGV